MRCVGVGIAVIVLACAACTLLSASDIDALTEQPAERAPSVGDASVGDASVGDGSSTDVDGRSPDTDAADADAAPDPHLVAAWSFDETSGRSARDATGHGHDAHLGGDATFAAGGVRGGAIKLGGAGYASVDSLGGTKFPRSGTLSVWIRFDFPPTDPLERGILDLWEDDRPHVFFRRKDDAVPGEFQFALQVPPSGDYAWSETVTLDRAEWAHIVFSWDEGARRAALYRDGATIASGAYAAAFAPTGQRFRIGEVFIGNIDEIRLYDRALTSSEVKDLP